MNSVIAEGKTTAEAIENGLKQLNVSKDKVNIKVLENAEKRSFFSILAPRVVKVELTLKDVKEHYAPMQEHVNQITPEQIEIAKKNLTVFLDEFSTKFEDFDYDIKVNGNDINVELKGNDSSKLIGYRGETLNSIQHKIKGNNDAAGHQVGQLRKYQAHQQGQHRQLTHGDRLLPYR